eukprot:TRINITY_DN10820_c0_g1_i1.p1 TRINITY_DN10820_c0_g1~~TRINITY_DN10820_c0_g1_i1.p1  ORF type:complete len:1641 (+),score=449.54 TRINITY_DN10820_c0_g1_i1:82-5004(+)
MAHDAYGPCGDVHQWLGGVSLELERQRREQSARLRDAERRRRLLQLPSAGALPIGTSPFVGDDFDPLAAPAGSRRPSRSPSRSLAEGSPAPPRLSEAVPAAELAGHYPFGTGVGGAPPEAAPPPPQRYAPPPEHESVSRLRRQVRALEGEWDRERQGLRTELERLRRANEELAARRAAPAQAAAPPPPRPAVAEPPPSGDRRQRAAELWELGMRILEGDCESGARALSADRGAELAAMKTDEQERRAALQRLQEAGELQTAVDAAQQQAEQLLRERDAAEQRAAEEAEAARVGEQRRRAAELQLCEEREMRAAAERRLEDAEEAAEAPRRELAAARAEAREEMEEVRRLAAELQRARAGLEQERAARQDGDRAYQELHARYLTDIQRLVERDRDDAVGGGANARERAEAERLRGELSASEGARAALRAERESALQELAEERNLREKAERARAAAEEARRAAEAAAAATAAAIARSPRHSPPRRPRSATPGLPSPQLPSGRARSPSRFAPPSSAPRSPQGPLASPRRRSSTLLSPPDSASPVSMQPCGAASAAAAASLPAAAPPQLPASAPRRYATPPLPPPPPPRSSRSGSPYPPPPPPPHSSGAQSPRRQQPHGSGARSPPRQQPHGGGTPPPQHHGGDWSPRRQDPQQSPRPQQQRAQSPPRSPPRSPSGGAPRADPRLQAERERTRRAALACRRQELDRLSPSRRRQVDTAAEEQRRHALRSQWPRQLSPQRPRSPRVAAGRSGRVRFSPTCFAAEGVSVAVQGSRAPTVVVEVLDSHGRLQEEDAGDTTVAASLEPPGAFIGSAAVIGGRACFDVLELPPKFEGCCLVFTVCSASAHPAGGRSVATGPLVAAGARAAADEAAARARRRLAAALAQRAEQRLRARVWRRWALRAAEKRWSALYRKQRAAEPRRPLCGGALPRHLWAKLAREVKAGSVHALAVRGLLRGVSTLAAANAVLRAAEAVSIGGKGDLQLDLLTPEDGALPERWGRTAEIAYDAFGNCPLQVGSVVAAAASEPAVARIAGLCSAAQAPAGLGECVEGRIACVATGRLLVVRSTVSGASCTVDGRPHALPCGFSVGGGGLLLRFPAPANARPIAAAAPPGDAALGLQLTALSRAVATAAAFGDEAAARCSLPVAVPAADAAAALEAPPAELQADLCVAAPIASQDGGGGFDLHCARRPPPLRSGDAVRRNRLMWPGGNADGGGAGAVELTTDGGAAAWVIWTATGARLLYAWGRQDRYHIAPAEAPLPQAWSARVRFSRIERRSGFALGPDGAAVLASVIALGVPIRRIALANHRLGRSGAAHLLGAVRKNHNVRQVYMRDPASADPDYAAACCALELLCASRRRTLPMTLLLRTCVADCWPSAVAAALHEEPEWPLPLPDMCAAHRDAARLCYDELRARRSAATPAVGQLGLLCVASWRSDTPGEARRLLEAGADPAERDTGGRLPLHYAASEPAWGQHPDGLGALRALCAVPGAPAAVDSSGATPLHRACRHGAPESAIALLEALRQQEGAAALAGLLRVRDKQGRTPLYLATENPLYCGAAGAVGALCGAEGVLSIADSDGWTPLHSACFHLHSGTVRILLDLGADPCARDGDGDPPLVAAEQVSQRQGREAGAAVVAMLRSAMAAAARP